jgi:phage terminase small subunit
MKRPDILLNSPESRLIWDKLVPPLEEAGLVEPIDVFFLSLLCQSIRGLNWVEAAIDELGLIMKDGRLNPAAEVADWRLDFVRDLIDDLDIEGDWWRIKGTSAEDVLARFMTGEK